METRHFIGVKVSKEALFKAISTDTELVKWWATNTTGSIQENHIVELGFSGLTTLKFKCDEIVENEKLVLTCFQSFKAWNDTKLIFSIKEEGNQTFLNLIHRNIAGDDIASYTYFSTKWPVYLLSLKQYLETGKGTPYPFESKLYDGD